jgi:hypothetical protein
MVGLTVSFIANVERMLANNSNIMLLDFPAWCVRPPSVEFPKPPHLDGQNDATEKEEELGGGVMTLAPKG